MSRGDEAPVAERTMLTLLHALWPEHRGPVAELGALGDMGGEQWGGLTFVVVVGGGEGTLVDVVGQEAMEGVLKGGEGCLVIGVQDGTLMFVQMLQEAGGGVRPHTQSWGEGQRN